MQKSNYQNQKHNINNQNNRDSIAVNNNQKIVNPVIIQEEVRFINLNGLMPTISEIESESN